MKKDSNNQAEEKLLKQLLPRKNLNNKKQTPTSKTSLALKKYLSKHTAAVTILVTASTWLDFSKNTATN